MPRAREVTLLRLIRFCEINFAFNRWLHNTSVRKNDRIKLRSGVRMYKCNQPKASWFYTSLSTGLEQLAVKTVVPISVVRIIIILIVRVIIPEGTSQKETTIVPETISVIKMPSSVFRKDMATKAMATKTTPAKPTETATATGKMAAAMPTTMAASSSAVSKCGGRHDR